MLVSVFDFEDYRAFLNTWIDQQSLRGVKSQISQALGVSSSLISLILKGEKQLSPEQALDAADFIGLNEKETDYFLLLVELSRAGTLKLKNRLKTKIKQTHKESQQLSKRLKKDLELNDEKKAIYYSSWIYTGLRNLIALEKHHDVAGMAYRLGVPTSTINQCLEFLIENSLAITKNSKITYGPTYTHVGQDSPFVNKHHQNWRIKGIQQMDAKNETDLFYTCPMSLSEKDGLELRSYLLKVIQEVLKTVGPSPSEEVRCLNIDFFKY